MKMKLDEFLASPHKAITLMGMSGVGKTHISTILGKQNWDHFSADYQIGKEYLNDEIEKALTDKARKLPSLAELLEKEAISIRNEIRIDRLDSVSDFLGKLGNPEEGGMPKEEFLRRQKLYLDAEIKAALEVPEKIRASRQAGYDHFINDSTGSLCETESEAVYECLAQHTLIIYLKTSDEDEARLVQEAEASPKPLYYRRDFILGKIDEYKKANGLEYLALMEPDKFIRWIFSQLFHSRLPRYQDIADRFGYTVSAKAVYETKSEAEFLDLIANHAR